LFGQLSSHTERPWLEPNVKVSAMAPQASKPPSTLRVSPVTKAACGLAKKATALATSSGRP